MSALSGASVLLLGHEAANRRLTRVHLEQAGAHVFAAASVREALLFMREVAIDAVLASCRMNDGGGAGLVSAMRNQSAANKVPVVALTGLPLSASDACDLGFDGFVQKPYDCSELVAELQRVLRLR